MSAKVKPEEKPSPEPVYKYPVQKGSIFGGGKFNPQYGKGHGFAKTAFKTQHKGG